MRRAFFASYLRCCGRVLSTSTSRGFARAPFFGDDDDEIPEAMRMPLISSTEIKFHYPLHAITPRFYPSNVEDKAALDALQKSWPAVVCASKNIARIVTPKWVANGWVGPCGLYAALHSVPDDVLGAVVGCAEPPSVIRSMVALATPEVLRVSGKKTVQCFNLRTPVLTFPNKKWNKTAPFLDFCVLETPVQSSTFEVDRRDPHTVFQEFSGEYVALIGYCYSNSLKGMGNERMQEELKKLQMRDIPMAELGIGDLEELIQHICELRFPLSFVVSVGKLVEFHPDGLVAHSCDSLYGMSSCALVPLSKPHICIGMHLGTKTNKDNFNLALLNGSPMIPAAWFA
eukprot:TRINITY_DN54045_c0_g1_i1.p1 TRINITY_DN54045_c0_g1~~TRINITY_DN54045_c0_g1_i1.p1  ORF type:complete len:350 (+),score=42.36 TRINITY_DN54045_c0_g1_i1:23-1051(+)